MGGYTSAEAVALADFAAENKVLMIFSGCSASLEVTKRVLSNPVDYKYVFRITYNTTQWAQIMGRFMSDIMKAKTYWFEGIVPLAKRTNEFYMEVEKFASPRG